MMIEYVERKHVNWPVVQDLLAKSCDANKWTNFGPISAYFEEQVHAMLGLSDNLTVVGCVSGTAALNAVVGLQEYLQSKKLHWAVSSFGFACTKQGALLEATVIDCDETGHLDLDRLPECDGVVVTNVFGARKSLQEYRNFCSANNKVIIIDAATAFDSYEHGPNEIISFHHTKPWGFGEGGCAIVLKEHRDIVKKIINFGLCNDYSNFVASNGKISDVAAAFISQRLNEMPTTRPRYEQQYKRIAKIGTEVGLKILGHKMTFEGTAPNVPFLAPNKMSNTQNPLVVLQKYYRPLAQTPVAANLFDRILCFPCHCELETVSDSEIRACLDQVLAQNTDHAFHVV